MSIVMSTVSIVVTTYNWKEALEVCLRSIAAQRVQPVEVVVADDGSRDDTAALVQRMATFFPVPLVHAWQEDIGFRAARVRNLGIRRSRGDYVVFIDGDMVLHPEFIADHLRFIRPGIYLQGSRLCASPAESKRILDGGTPRFSPLMPGEFKRRHALHMPWLTRLKMDQAHSIVMSCNMGIWRSDLYRVNGFDERYEGWGREDDDLAARLKHSGVPRRALRYAGLAIHLWHQTRWPNGIPPNEKIPNDALYRETLSTYATHCEHGIEGHFQNRDYPSE